MIEILKVSVLSLLPISELRGAIPYGIYQSINLPYLLLIVILSNFLVAPIVFLFLDILHGRLIKFKIYSRIFNYYVKRTRKRIEHKIGTSAEFLALFLLVAIPLPMTGAYTGTLAAWLFDLERKKAIFYIFLGIMAAGTVVTLTSLGLFSLFS